MGYTVLTDNRGIGRSILFCTTSDRPLDHEAFSGDDSEEQAEDFLTWLGDVDPRALSSRALDKAIQDWRRAAFDADGETFVGAPARV